VVLGLNSGQWISVAILAVGAMVWLWSPRPESPAAPAPV